MVSAVAADLSRASLVLSTKVMLNPSTVTCEVSNNAAPVVVEQAVDNLTAEEIAAKELELAAKKALEAQIQATGIQV